MSYLISVIIWSIILITTEVVFDNAMRKNGWFGGRTVKYHRFIPIACIPLIRLLLWIGLLYMAIKEKTDV